MKTLILCNIFILFIYHVNAQSRLQSTITESDLPSPGSECGSINNASIIQDAPWSALIYYAGRRAGFYCGGSLISHEYVLTVAHCIRGRYSDRRYTLKFVRLGEINLEIQKNCRPGECVDPVLDVSIAEKIIHENYNPKSYSHHHDIALIRLAHPVTFTERIRPICLPFAQNLRDQNFDQVQLVAVGFGRTKDGQRSKVKTMQGMRGYSSDRCNEVFRQTRLNLIQTQICAAGEHDDDDCSAGGGGSLVGEHTINQTSYRYLAGIESFGSRECGVPNSPGIFTRIDQYLDWILNNMRCSSLTFDLVDKSVFSF